MARGRREILAAVAVTGALAAGGAALADAATNKPAATPTATPKTAPRSGAPAPRHRGNCPNMPGGGSSRGGSQQGATAL
ncbi:MAG TPA: hypothetical protein VH418_15995 [Solirubrobacteraceae bacterium]|jgi:hypothetical protein